jgi:mannose-6-phosphate isomerase-like protein (cupin superfamily)/DNA-binding XRE family transcriptional regulator
MTLRELATSAEMSASMLSQIETGKSYPSVRSIYTIAAALDVPVDYFFPDQDSGSPNLSEAQSLERADLTASEMREVQVGRNTVTAEPSSPIASSTPVVHAGARPTIQLSGGVTWARLTALAEPDSEFLEITYLPGASSGAHLSHHGGREFGLVLEGELVVELGFDLHTLYAGDSIVFDSMTPHRLTNQSCQIMRAVWVVLNRTR